MERFYGEAILSVRTRLILAPVFIASLLAPTAAAEDFSTVVSEILRNRTDGPISEMGDEKKAAMIACVSGVLVDLPSGKKQYVLEGATLDERQDRFGRVLYENHAEWQKKIAGGCAALAQ